MFLSVSPCVAVGGGVVPVGGRSGGVPTSCNIYDASCVEYVALGLVAQDQSRCRVMGVE
jgi:hypothetical protein